MTAQLVEYLTTYGQLPLPGMGMLLRSAEQAPYSAADRTYLPAPAGPQWVSGSAESYPIQHLVGFLSKHTNQSEEESFEALHTWIGGTIAACKDGQKVALSSLGTWNGTATGDITFTPHTAFDQYLAPRPAEKLVHTGQTHKMTVGDKETDTVTMQQELEEQMAATDKPVTNRWWVPALIAALITGALVVLRLAGLF